MRLFSQSGVFCTFYFLSLIHIYGMEQVIILGHGALRVSARMFHEEVQNVEKQIRALVQGQA